MACIAIIITIMVLELKVPHGADWPALAACCRCSELCAELHLSSASTGTTTITCCTPSRTSTARILWANLHLLFWLSLIPVRDRVDGRESPGADTHRDLWRRPADGRRSPITCCRRRSSPDRARNRCWQRRSARIRRARFRRVLYLAGIALAFVSPWSRSALYVLVALMWLIPDRRIERTLREG